MLAAIDIETTGLDENVCQILEFGCILWEPGSDKDERRSWRFWHSPVVGEPYALNLNAKIISEMKFETTVSTFQFWRQFEDWIYELGLQNKKITIIGKNFGMFDSRFLRKINFPFKYFDHRCIDIGNLYLKPEDNGKIPNTGECALRAGLDLSAYAVHTALGDCQLVKDLYTVWENGF